MKQYTVDHLIHFVGGRKMELFHLKGKTALITGASSGLGARFAQVLSEAGAYVILAARSKEKLEKVSLGMKHSQVVLMDVANQESVQTVFQDLEKQGAKIDICVNNAGIAKRTPVFTEDTEHLFDSIMQTNVMGTWYVTQSVTRHMKQHNIHGSIINIASINGANRLGPEFAGYCASKAAVIQMTKALSGELAPHHIRITAISPGLFHTPLTAYRMDTTEKRHALEQLVPLGFVAEPSDLDGMILYLASNQASKYVTGTCMTVDGGMSWGGG